LPLPEALAAVRSRGMITDAKTITGAFLGRKSTPEQAGEADRAGRRHGAVAAEAKHLRRYTGGARSHWPAGNGPRWGKWRRIGISREHGATL
jgi:hypothetical protein